MPARSSDTCLPSQHRRQTGWVVSPHAEFLQSKRQRRWDAVVEDSCHPACCTRQQLPTRCEGWLSLWRLTRRRRKGPFDPDFLQLLAHVILGTILSKVRHISTLLNIKR